MAKNSRGEWLTRLLLVTCSIAVSVALLFLAGEAYLRIWSHEDRYRPIPEWYVADERLGWVLKPSDFTGFNAGSFRKYHIVVNSLGFRGREPTLEPPAGQTRITVLGDSHLFGMILDADDRIPERLGAMLGDGTDVVNVSVPGYGTGQEILFLEDLVSQGYVVGSTLVLVFCTNDLLDNPGLRYATLGRSPRKPSFEVRDDGTLAVTRPTRISIPKGTRASASPVTKWLSNKLCYAFLRERAMILAARNPWMVTALTRLGVSVDLEWTPAIITAWYSPGLEERWKVTRDLISYLAASDLVGEAEFLVVFLPSVIQIEKGLMALAGSKGSNADLFSAFLEDPDRPQRFLSEFCSDAGISFIDATPGLRRAATREPMYFLREGHVNEAGSAEIASQIHEWLTNGGAVPVTGTDG